MKVLKIILLVIGACLLLVIAGAAGVCFSMIDNTNNANAEIENNPRELNSLLNEYLVDSMAETKTNEKVSFLLSEYQTNYVLSSIKNSIKIDFLDIKAIYSIYQEDGSVRFEAPITIAGFNSVVRGDLDMSLDESGTFTLLVKSVAIGKLTSKNSLVKGAIEKYADMEYVKATLKEQGIDIDFDIKDAELKATMTKEQMKTTAESLIKDSETVDLVNVVIETMIGKEQLFGLRFNDEDAIGVVLYLQQLAYQETPVYDIESGEKNITTVKAMLTTLFNENIATYDNLNAVFDFLVRGYSPIKDEEKEVIDKLSFKSVGITYPKLYKGILNKSETTMGKIFLDAAEADMGNISNIMLNGYYDITIEEANFNELLNSLDFVGTSFAFIKDDGTVASITISSLFTDLKKDAMDMYLLLDVNGKYIYAKVEASVKENKGTLLTLKIDKLYLGSIELDQKVNNSLLKYLQKVLAETTYISVDPEAETISLDFSTYIKGEFFQMLEQASLTKYSITCSDEDEGKLIIRVSKNA